MLAPFELLTLGVPRLRTSKGHDVRVRTRKHMALLVYLAVERSQAERRERLIDLLWPRVPLTQGRSSLATALSALRARLGRETIEGDRDHVRFSPGAVRLDLDRLKSGDLLGDDFTPALEVDEFLAQFEVEDAPEFQIWRERQRARLRPSLEYALITLADLARRTANLAELSRVADRLLTLNELSEEGVRARMEAHALAGDRLTAVRIYDDWAARLSSELSARPAPLLEGMAKRLRLRGLERTKDSPLQAVRTEQWRSRPFIGRAREFRLLYDLWESLPTTGARYCFILGDSGVGKTTLADRLATAVALEGATVARVRCFELERGIPFATLNGLVELLLHKPGAAATDQQALAEIGRIVNGVSRCFPNLPPPVEIRGEAARIRFAEAVLVFLTALMDEHPVVLIVDDYALSDDASLSVLHLLLRRLSDKPFMVVLITRTEVPTDSPSTIRIRQEASHLGATLLSLEPMPRPEMEGLLDALACESAPMPGPTERRVLLGTASGNPLALELLYRDWIERGQDSVVLSVGAMTKETAANPELALQLLAEGLLRAVDGPTRQALNLAAVLDRRLNELGMYEIVDQTQATAMACLTRLIDIRVLRDRGGGLEFVNPGRRAQAYLGIPAPLRRRLHAQVADRLLVREAQGESFRGLDLAWHCIRAGRAQEAAPFLVRGCREAIDDGAPHEAELALSSGIELLNGSLKDQGFLLWGEALQELGRWGDAKRVLRDVLPSEHGDLALNAELLTLLSDFWMGHLGHEDTGGAMKRLMHVARFTTQPCLRVLAVSIGASLNEIIREPDFGDHLEGSANVISHSNLTPVDGVRCLLAKAMLRYQRRDILSARPLLHEAGELCDRHGIRSSSLTRLYSGLGSIAVVEGDYLAGESYYKKAYEVAWHVGNDRAQGQCATNLALCCGRLGNYDSQLRWASRASTLLAEIGDWANQMSAAAFVGFSAAILGRKHEARQAVEDVLHHSEGQRPWALQKALIMAADVCIVLDDRDRAFALARRATSRPLDKPLSVALTGCFARWLAALSVDADDESAVRHRAVIADLLADRHSYDALDQVEVLCAAELHGLATSELVQELGERVARLPPASVDLLGRLGMSPR